MHSTLSEKLEKLLLSQTRGQIMEFMSLLSLQNIGLQQSIKQNINNSTQKHTLPSSH